MSSAQPVLVSRLNTGVTAKLLVGQHHRAALEMVEDSMYSFTLDSVGAVVYGSVDEDASVLAPWVFPEGTLDAVREVLARPA